MSVQRDALKKACEIVRCHVEGVPQYLPYRGSVRSLMRVAECGSLERNMVTFDDMDVAHLRHWLTAKGVKPDVGPASGSTLTRTELSAHQADEKAGAASIGLTHHLAAIAAAGTQSPIINEVAISRARSAGEMFRVMDARALASVTADWILMVENLENFIALANNHESCGFSREGAGLIVFRTAPAFPKGQAWAHRARALSSAPICHAPDMDPAGLRITLDVDADEAWLPDLAVLATSQLAALSELLHNQAIEYHGLPDRVRRYFPALLPWVEEINRIQGGHTQERLLAHGIPMIMVTR